MLAVCQERAALCQKKARRKEDVDGPHKAGHDGIYLVQSMTGFIQRK
jgi:hypothetical protein